MYCHDMNLCKDCNEREAVYPRTICKPCRSAREVRRRANVKEGDRLKQCTIDGCEELRYEMPSQVVNLCQEHWKQQHREKSYLSKPVATVDRIRQQNRDSQDRHRMRRRYGIDYAAEMAKRPEGRCDACGVISDTGPLQVDHCHRTLAFRGMLCGSCNRALGHADDNIERLEALIVYLRKYERL